MLFEVAVPTSTRPGSLKDPLSLTDRHPSLFCDLPVGETINPKTNDVTVARLPVNLVLRQDKSHTSIVKAVGPFLREWFSRVLGTDSRAPLLAEMERSSEAYDESVGQVLDAEDTLLQANVREVMSSGSTTAHEPTKPCPFSNAFVHVDRSSGAGFTAVTPLRPCRSNRLSIGGHPQ
jgi:hypothetical protein